MSQTISAITGGGGVITGPSFPDEATEPPPKRSGEPGQKRRHARFRGAPRGRAGAVEKNHYPDGTVLTCVLIKFTRISVRRSPEARNICRGHFRRWISSIARSVRRRFSESRRSEIGKPSCSSPSFITSARSNPPPIRSLRKGEIGRRFYAVFAAFCRPSWLTFAILRVSRAMASFQRDATKPQERRLRFCEHGKLGGPTSPAADPNPPACRCNNGRLMRTRSRTVPLLPDSAFFLARGDAAVCPTARGDSRNP